jgi:adenosine deaminase
VSVNTDKRLMSNATPSSELRTVADVFGLSHSEVTQLVTNGVMAGFAPIELRRRIVADLSPTSR